MSEFCCWLRAKLDVWLMQMDDFFDVDLTDDDETE